MDLYLHAYIRLHGVETDNFYLYYAYEGSRVSTVAIATRYCVDSLGFEPGGKKRLPLLPTRPEILGTTQIRVKWVTGVFPGGEAAGRVVDHPAPPSTEVNETESYTSAPPWHLHCT